MVTPASRKNWQSNILPPRTEKNFSTTLYHSRKNLHDLFRTECILTARRTPYFRTPVPTNSVFSEILVAGAGIDWGFQNSIFSIVCRQRPRHQHARLRCRLSTFRVSIHKALTSTRVSPRSGLAVFACISAAIRGCCQRYCCQSATASGKCCRLDAPIRKGEVIADQRLTQACQPITKPTNRALAVRTERTQSPGIGTHESLTRSNTSAC
jgi:hypothetical protein